MIRSGDGSAVRTGNGAKGSGLRKEESGMLAWVLWAGAAVCLAYYIAIVIYAGFSVSFSWFWPMAALFLFLAGCGIRYDRFHPKKMPLWLPVSAATFAAAAAVIFCTVETMVFLGATTADFPGLDYVIVLGAKVHPDGISNSLRKRLNKAVEYSRENPDTVFVLSGGQGKDEPVPEARAMHDYLVNNGIPESRLVLETSSASTAENLAYSKVLIDKLEKEKLDSAGGGTVTLVPGPYLEVERRPVEIGVLTSSYHVFRARKIGEKWGIKNIRGISAGSDMLLFPHLCVRECAAILKDRLMGNL